MLLETLLLPTALSWFVVTRDCLDRPAWVTHYTLDWAERHVREMVLCESAPPPAFLLHEDFEDGVADGWSPALGAWSVSGAENIIYEQSSLLGDGVTSAGDVAWTDYSVEATATPLEFDATGGFVRLMGRFQDAGNYYYLLIRSTGVLELKKLLAGKAVLLASKPYAVAPGVFYRLRLDLLDAELKAYVDGVLELSVTDIQFAAGRVGLGTYNAVAAFDDVTVTPLPPSVSGASILAAEAMCPVYNAFVPIRVGEVPQPPGAVEGDYIETPVPDCDPLPIGAVCYWVTTTVDLYGRKSLPEGCPPMPVPLQPLSPGQVADDKETTT